MTERYSIKEIEIDDYTVECADAKLVVADGDTVLSNEQVVKKLNWYVQDRKRKGREIEKFRKREELYQRVIGGFKAYLELELNSELWWDWNE